MKKQNKKGFTLVELLVVIAILAILATVSVVGYSQFTTKAKESNDMTELHQYTTLIEAQLMDGEEVVKVGDTEYTVKFDNTNGVTFVKTADKTDYNADSEFVTKVVKELLGDKDATINDSAKTTISNLTSGGKIVVTYTAKTTEAKGTIKLEYTHNLAEATAVTTWTLGA